MLRVLVPFVSLLLSLHLFAAGHDLSPTAARQLRPVVTANGSGLTAAWIEETGAPKRRVLAGRVSAGGQPLDGAGIQLDQSLATSIAIAHSSSEALIVWGTSEGVVAARLSPFGSVLDPLPILIARQPFPSIAVAWNGERYFVLWTDSFELFGAFVSREGTMTSPMQLGSQSALRHYLSAPDVAWDGHQFIVVFSEVVIEGQVQCGECPQPAPDHVNVMRVSANGDAIDAIPIRIPGLHVRAHVASSGAESLIALDSDSDTSTMVVREENGGLQLAPEAPLLHWFSNIGSAVAWDGSTYSVAWRSPTWANTPGWLGVSRITPAGDALLSLVTTVGPADYSQPMTPSVTASDTGEIVLVAAEILRRPAGRISG